MKVRCIRSRLADLGEIVRERLQRSIHLEHPLPGLRVGAVYDVIAVRTVDEGLWLMLHTVEDNEYPYPYPVEMFEVVDPHAKHGWIVDLTAAPEPPWIRAIGPSEWIQGDSFYERLVNGDSGARRTYQSTRHGKVSLSKATE